MEPAVHRPPDQTSTERGLAYCLWLPDRGPSGRRPSPPWRGVVICHGAGSRKENHADFAREAASTGWAALTFDARGHGASEGSMSPEVVGDVVLMARLLGAQEGVDPMKVAARGSSMGGFFAIHAAAVSREIAGVIAVCPASEEGLRRSMRGGKLEMRIDDPEGLDAWLAEHDLFQAVTDLWGRPLILLHAEGDQSVPVEISIELHERALEPRKLIIVPGGDHRSVQHDAELQAVSLRWLGRELDRLEGGDETAAQA